MRVPFRTNRKQGSPRPAGRFRSRRGSELVEGMLMLLPFFAFVFLIIDTSYALFIKATLQNAVESGTYYALVDTSDGLLAGIQNTVQAQSMNLIPTSAVNISFYTPTALTTNLTANGPVAGANAAGNVLQVQVSYNFAPLAPLFRSGAMIPLTATSSTVLIANPTPAL